MNIVDVGGALFFASSATALPPDDAADDTGSAVTEPSSAPPADSASQAAPKRARVSRPGFIIPSGLSVSQAQVVADITAAATHWGVSVSWMLRTANCESHFHWNSVNPSGPYIGVFQFLMSTFIANGGTAATIWSPVAQANIAAKMFAHGQAHEWSCA